jgi:hypothetical protein
MAKSKARMRGYVALQESSQPVEAADPLVWMVNRLRTNDQDQPLREGIFSNYNDDIVLEVDSNTLVGRYDPARGPAQRLVIGDGLSVEDGALVASGVPGPPGPEGPPGPMGASSSMWLYRFDSSTAQNDPGAGRYRMNNLTPASATVLYIDRLTQDGLDPTTMFKIANFDDDFIIQERGVAAHYQQWKIKGPAVVVAGDWFTLPVQFVSQAGGNFSNNNEVTFLVRTIGQPGPQGPPGVWVQMTQAAYNALSPPNPTTLYVIIG